MEIESSPGAMKYAVFTTAWRASVGGVAQRVRQERPSWVCAPRARVGIASRHWSVRRAREPVIASSPLSPRTVTRPPSNIVRETGAGPQDALHSWTVKVSLIGERFQAPSYGPAAAAVRPPGTGAPESRRATTNAKKSGARGVSFTFRPPISLARIGARSQTASERQRARCEATVLFSRHPREGRGGTNAAATEPRMVERRKWRVVALGAALCLLGGMRVARAQA